MRHAEEALFMIIWSHSTPLSEEHVRRQFPHTFPAEGFSKHNAGLGVATLRLLLRQRREIKWPEEAGRCGGLRTDIEEEGPPTPETYRSCGYPVV